MQTFTHKECFEALMKYGMMLTVSEVSLKQNYHSFLLSMLSFAKRICFCAERVYSQNSQNHIHASPRSAKYCVCSGAQMIPIERLGLPLSKL